MNVGNIEVRGQNKYRLTVSGGYDVNGKRIKYRKTITAKSEKEAKKQLALFIAEIEKNEYVEPNKLTFSEFVSKWKENYAEENLEAKTYDRYKGLLKDNILPYIGNLKLEQIKPPHLLDLYKALSKNGARKDGKEGGYSQTTIRHVHQLVRAILEKAVLWQYLLQNPASRVEPPKANTREAEFYTEDELKLIIQRLENEEIRLQAIIKTLLYTGMRRSELIGLEWSDIDFSENTIYIRRASVYIPGKGTLTKSTKTVRSERVIPLAEVLKSCLIKYKEWQENQRSYAGELWNESGRVITQTFGDIANPDVVGDNYRKFLKRNPDLKKINMHGLRHSTATLLLSAGVDIETVSRILGHASSITTSKVYLHTSSKNKMDAIEKMERALADNKVKKIDVEEEK